MSHNSISTIFVIVALVYATSSTPFADATFARTLTVTGRLCCTTNGNCFAGSTGVSGATVTLRCLVGLTFTPTVVATAPQTGTTGNFAFTTVTLPPFTLPSLCVVLVQLPLTGAAASSCPLLGGAAPRTLTARVRITNNGEAATGTAGIFV